MSEIAHSFSLAGPTQKPSKQEQDRESGRPKTKALTKFAQVGATYWPSYSILQNIVSIKPETRMAASAEGILNLSLLCIFPAAVLIQGVPKKQTRMAKHGCLVNIPKWFKMVEMVNLYVFDHLGPFWAHMNTFGPFQTKIKLLPHKDKVRFYRGAFEPKKSFFCLKWFKRAQTGPK